MKLESFIEGLDRLGNDTAWEDEWVGMPEFNQPGNQPYLQIEVKFKSQADVDTFSKLIEQELTLKSNSIWHPKKIQNVNINTRYIDEEE